MHPSEARQVQFLTGCVYYTHTQHWHCAHPGIQRWSILVRLGVVRVVCGGHFVLFILILKFPV